MKFYQKYLQILSEMPNISLRGKSVYADEEPLKGLPTVKVEKNIVMVRQPTSGGFVAEGWTLVYFMDTEEAAQDFRDNTEAPAILSVGYTVATLPAGVVGQRAFVTDADTPVFLDVLGGGGTTACPVFHNGTTWVAG